MAPIASRPAWSIDAAVELEKLWKDESLSARMIAEKLGMTRNAVLGKVHRLGLAHRQETFVARPRTEKPRREPRPSKVPGKLQRIQRAGRSHEGMKPMTFAAVKEIGANPTKSQLRKMLEDAMANTALLCEREAHV